LDSKEYNCNEYPKGWKHCRRIALGHKNILIRIILSNRMFFMKNSWLLFFLLLYLYSDKNFFLIVFKIFLQILSLIRS
jgi:hypothetical protein